MMGLRATEPADTVVITVTVNDEVYRRTVEPRTTLADFLRDDLSLTGTKLGCEHGVCGACTVLLDGSSARACLTLAAQCDESSVRTVEGLAPGRALGELQQAFMERHGLQCGFCTAGFLMTASDLLATDPNPSEHVIRSALAGNICRCTGYESIIDAVLAVTQRSNSD